MTEQYYQKKIIKAIEKNGGHCVNGIYTQSGEADLQCGFPVNDKLLYVAIEVKTEKAYKYLMKGLDSDYNVIDDKKLKPHEFLQMAKIRKVRRLGGLALVAWNYTQVKEYINGKALS